MHALILIGALFVGQVFGNVKITGEVRTPFNPIMTPTGTTQTIDFATGSSFYIDLESVNSGAGGALAITVQNLSEGSGLIVIRQDSGAALSTVDFTAAAGTLVWVPGGTEVEMVATADKMCVYSFLYLAEITTWFAQGSCNG